MFNLRCNKIKIISKFVAMYLGHRQKEAIIITSSPRRICIIESGGCGHFLGQAKQPIQVYVCTP